jgi:tetratricopeptide (TPR) repeat protein
MINFALTLQNRGVDAVRQAVVLSRTTGHTTNTKLVLDEATVVFQKALSLIVNTTQVHMLENAHLYDFYDDEGLIRVDQALATMLSDSIQTVDTGIRLVGPRNQYVYWVALKIQSGISGGDNNSHVCILNNNNTSSSSNTGTTSEDLSEVIMQEYQDVRCAIYHSAIVIFNLAICYQYSGKYHLAVDHYMQAYDLLTRFRRQDPIYCRLCLAIMNNMSVLYGLLDDHKRQNVCQQYLLSSLILLSQDGHQHLRPINNSYDDDRRAATQKQSDEYDNDQDLYEKFLGNVTHLFLVENAIAPAA